MHLIRNSNKNIYQSLPITLYLEMIDTTQLKALSTASNLKKTRNRSCWAHKKRRINTKLNTTEIDWSYGQISFECRVNEQFSWSDVFRPNLPATTTWAVNCNCKRGHKVDKLFTNLKDQRLVTMPLITPSTHSG